MSAKPPTHASFLRRLATTSVVVGSFLMAGCADWARLATIDTPIPSQAADDPAPTTAAPTTTPPTTTPPTTVPTTTTPPTTVPPTTAPPTTVQPTTDPEPSTSLRVGDEGAQVEAMQQRLVDLGFYLPSADGTFGSLTQQAVLAFQKASGLSRDGVAGPNTLEALSTATAPTPREGGDHIEIDLARQLVFLVRGDTTLVFNTSTGAPGMETPPGRFEITREIDGMRHAPLGQLWRPKYFNGGIALHGSNSIPGHAASHGCARLHNAVIDMVWEQDLAPIGTPVWVY